MKENRKRIWIFNHYADLNGHRHYELGMRLAEMGMDVSVIASSFSHSELRYTKDEVCVIQQIKKYCRFIWLRTSPPYRGNTLYRFLNMASYLHMVKLHSKQWWSEFGIPDVVIGSSVHPFAWEAANWISKKTGAVYLAEVRDLWPLSLVEIQGVNPRHPVVSFFRILEKRAYKRAKKIITTMPYAFRYISGELGFPRDKVIWIPNGIDTNKIDNVLANGDTKLPHDLDQYLSGNWCAVYAGSLVESECIDHILDAATVLQNKYRSNIKFAIIGDGHLKSKLQQKAEDNVLYNVRFFERISKDQVAVAVSKAKVCLSAIQNLSVFRYGLSRNKINDYLYSGNPTIFSCDVDNVVQSSGGGITVPYGDADLLADTITSVFNMSDQDRLEMVQKGRHIIKTQYDITLLSMQLLNLVNSCSN